MKLINTFTTEAVNLANKTVEQYNKVQEEYKRTHMETDENLIRKLMETIDEKDRRFMQTIGEKDKRIKELEEQLSMAKPKVDDIVAEWCQKNSYENVIYSYNFENKEIMKYANSSKYEKYVGQKVEYKTPDEYNKLLQDTDIII